MLLDWADMLDSATADRDLRSGSFWIAGALITNGVLTYVFLAAPARSGALSVADYGLFTTVWFVAFTLGSGAMVPLEQELTRRATEELHGPALPTDAGPQRWLGAAGVTAVAIVLAVAVALGVFAEPVAAILFDGDQRLVLASALSVAGFAVSWVVRGWLAGIGRFRAYAFLIVVDSVIRLVFVLYLIGMTDDSRPSIFSYSLGLGMGVAGVIGLVMIRFWPRHTSPTAVSEFFQGWIVLAGSQLLAQLVVNGPVLLAPVLAQFGEDDIVGQLGAVLVVVRAPVILFPALAATMLPYLTRLVLADDYAGFTAALNRFAILSAAAVAAAGLAGALLGPTVVGILFGAEFVLGPVVTGMLGAGSLLFVWASTESLGLLALGRRSLITRAWLMAVVLGLVAAIWRSDLALRVSIAFVVGNTAALLMQRWSNQSEVNRRTLGDARAPSLQPLN